MSEKGGKGLKSSFKSKDGLLGGKDGNSPNLKKSKKIHFGPQMTPGSNYKILDASSDQPFQSFSAKGDKPTKSSKYSVAKETQSSEFKDLPNNAKCMMDCEAFEILEGIKDHVTLLSEDPSIKIPVSFDRALTYLESGIQYSSPPSVRQLLDPLKMHGISDAEMCIIANACPETADEVFAFIPSLKGKKEEINQTLEDASVKLSKLKKSE